MIFAEVASTLKWGDWAAIVTIIVTVGGVIYGIYKRDLGAMMDAFRELKTDNEKDHDKLWTVHGEDARRLDVIAIDQAQSKGEVASLKEKVRDMGSDFKDFQRQPKRGTAHE